jgi:5-methylcytosine-specific restriction endonuclease McrA
MRPIRRGASPRLGDFSNYRDALPDLVSRLGRDCSYCERLIPVQLAVEHIQPKGLPAYRALIGRWDNFLLACVNCNSTKLDKDVVLSEVLLPDRDNTFSAYLYDAGGGVQVSPRLLPPPTPTVA